MVDREKVIRGLEQYQEAGWAGINDYYRPFVSDALDLLKALEPCDDCISRKAALDALHRAAYWLDAEQKIEKLPTAVPRAQEPRVMTRGDLRGIGSVWDMNTPPYLWVEINPAFRWVAGAWVAWREIYDMMDGLNPTYDADNYGQIWRCWTSRPSKEQREAMPWELMKTQRPGVMTLDEVITSEPGTVVWLEDYYKPDIISGLVFRTFIHTKVIDFLVVKEETNNEVTADLETYGNQWRCWTFPPTDAQREATPWK